MNACSGSVSTVFVVDDNDAVRESVKVFLDLLGFRVEVFGSVPEFVNGHGKLGKCCLILDHEMQPTTGLDFLESGAGRDLGIPVILITGQANRSIEQRARDVGVAAFLEKPLPLKSLVEHIRNLMANS